MTEATGSRLRDAITVVYAQVGAPEWASPNLDGLADVLRDLSWLPEGEVAVGVPELDGPDGYRLIAALQAMARETAGSSHPVVLD